MFQPDDRRNRQPLSAQEGQSHWTVYVGGLSASALLIVEPLKLAAVWIAGRRTLVCRDLFPDHRVCREHFCG